MRERDRVTAATVVALATLTAFAGTAVLVAPASAAPSADSICSGRSGPVLVGAVPGGDTSAGTVALYGGSEIELYLCENGRPLTAGSAWKLEPSDGFAVVDTTEYAYRVRLARSADGTIDLAGRVRRVRGVTGVSVRVTGRPEVDSALVDGTLTFPNRASAAEYRTAERRYLNAVRWLRSNATAAATAAGNGSVPDRSLTRTATLAKGLEAQRRGLLVRAYPVAWRAGDGTALSRINRSATAEADAARQEARAALRDALGRLRQRRSDAMGTVLLFAGGGLGTGLLAGVGVGWWITARKLKRIAYDRTVTSAATFGWRQVALPLALGLAVVAATVALAAVTVGLGTLLEGLL